MLAESFAFKTRDDLLLQYHNKDELVSSLVVGEAGTHRICNRTIWFNLCGVHPGRV